MPKSANIIPSKFLSFNIYKDDNRYSVNKVCPNFDSIFYQSETQIIIQANSRIGVGMLQSQNLFAYNQIPSYQNINVHRLHAVCFSHVM